MRIRTLIIYITTGFVFGILMLVVAQYITSKNVQELISGNESLLRKYKISNELVRLQKDLLLLDNNLKAAVSTGDSNKIKDFKLEIVKINDDLKMLSKTSDLNTPLPYLKELHQLVAKKIDFSNQMIDSLYKSGHPTSEHIFQSNKAIKLTEEITKLTHKIDTSGRKELALTIKSVDRSGQRVLNWNLYIIIMVLFLLIAVFLVIVNRMQKQSELINQLNTSEKKLKNAALIKENFLANMSHEIRTPLNAILGYTNLLKRKKLDDDSMLHLETVQQSGETLLSIVNDILDLSKIESGMMRIEQVPFSLPELIHSVTSMFIPKIEEKGLKLETIMTLEITGILIGDSTRLTQILVNLIGNAVKFTNEGRITLAVQAFSIDSKQVEITITVTDTGIGIKKEKLQTIFERFRQAEDSTTRKYGGTGLGLSIVRDLVYMQKGQIEVTSDPGLGTSVLVRIPYKLPDHLKELHQSNTKKQPHFRPNLKILVVEDNPVNQGLMSHIFREWQIKTVIASNGLEAIKILGKEEFDIVFMDIQMPEMDGYAATEEIRNKLKLNVPIIAMTAHAMQGDREKCIVSGMNDHISKPITESDIQDVIFKFSDFRMLSRNNSHAILSAENDYNTIDLDYLKGISNGDLEYEKLVTEQFIELVPQEISDLKNAFNEQDLPAIKHISHSLKTSISIMGLNYILNQYLDELENQTLDKKNLKSTIEKVTFICDKALAEARDFYSHF